MRRQGETKQQQTLELLEIKDFGQTHLGEHIKLAVCVELPAGATLTRW